jgi:molybdate transport repressor ModE-like protein
MSITPHHKPSFKFWLETSEGFVFGPGVYSILKKIKETGTLKEAAKSLGMSYRFAWGLLKKAEEKLGNPLVISHKGGRSGGGGFIITDLGLEFIQDFSKIEEIVNEIVSMGINNEPINQLGAIVVKLENVNDHINITLQTKVPVTIAALLPIDLLKKQSIEKGDIVNLEFISKIRSIQKN